MSSSITIHFGPFAVAFTSSSKPINTYLKDFFRGFECEGTPDCTVLILPSESMPHPLLQIQKEWIPLCGSGKKFEIGPDIIRGDLNLEHNEIAIAVHLEVFLPRLLRVFHSFLYRLYYVLCRHKKINSCFIHGCGVKDLDTGYLFIGPHESGKTTIGQTSQAAIIHDDQILLTLSGGGITIDSPPLPARDNLRRHPERPCVIERIFVVCKDAAFSVKPLAPAKAASALYSEIVLPLTLDAADEKTARKQKALLCFEILNVIPLYELHFDRQGNFWNMLRKMQWP